jgi:hypothetical protein
MLPTQADILIVMKTNTQPAMRKNTSTASFRFYAELNDFLPAPDEGMERKYRVHDNQSVKAAIEGFGVPHTKVELILINGVSVDFNCKVAG